MQSAPVTPAASSFQPASPGDAIHMRHAMRTVVPAEEPPRCGPDSDAVWSCGRPAKGDAAARHVRPRSSDVRSTTRPSGLIFADPLRNAHSRLGAADGALPSRLQARVDAETVAGR